MLYVLRTDFDHLAINTIFESEARVLCIGCSAPAIALNWH
jgi:hypothetical protein